MEHNLNAYWNGQEWVTFCKLCALEGEELSTSHCTGKVEPVLKNQIRDPKDTLSAFTVLKDTFFIKNDVDKSDIDAYVNRMIAANS